MPKKPGSKKSTDSMRERAAKAAATKPKTRRVRNAATSAGKPIRRILKASTQDYHLITPRESGLVGFLTKPRRFFPRYFVHSWHELRNVTWPNRRTTWKLVFAVFAFATVFGVAIAVVDFVLEAIFKRIIL